MKVSIVIPTYKRPGLAESLKKKILGYEPDVEVVIIDQSDSETPNTAAAKNLGLRQSSGEIIIFFDDDVEITTDTIRSHLLEYEDQSVVGVAGRVINDGEEIATDNLPVGKVDSFLTRFDKNFTSTKKQTVSFVYGCNMSFKKNVLLSVMGFDEKLPPPLSAFEEIDLSFKVAKLGIITFSPMALVYHHRAISGGTRLDERTRNKLYYKSYGRILIGHVPFPFVLYSLLAITVRIIKEAPYSLIDFFLGTISHVVDASKISNI